MADAMHVQELVSRARTLGADRAAPLPARAVVVDERVQLKCRVPLCESYGHNLMCPPNVPTPDETRAVLARYSDTLVLQQEIPMTQEGVDIALAGMGYPEAKAQEMASKAGRAATATYEVGLKESQNRFARLMTALEKEAFKMGYRFATAYAGGECVLCDVCVGPDGDACRHPFEARPSMEAVGIDVMATAEAAGLPIELPAVEHPRWTGLLLLD